MRQRAMIAMALACDPAIIIGDEPTTALDVMVQAQILELLEDLRAKLGLSLILITHDLSVIAETCDRVMIMYAGRVAEEGPVGRGLRRAAPPVHADAPARRSRTSTPDAATSSRSRASPPDLRTPPPGCRFHPRCPAGDGGLHGGRPAGGPFDDRVRVACHLYPPGSDGTPLPASPAPQVPVRSARAVSRPGRDFGAPCTVGDDLIRLEGLAGPLPDSRRASRHRPAPPPRVRPGRRRDRPHDPARRGARPGRGVRAAARRRPAGSIVKLTRPTGGRVLLDGEDVTGVWGGDALRALPAPRPAHLPGPVRDAEPEADDPRLRGRAAGGPRDREPRRSASARVLDAIEAAGLRPAADFAFRYPHELSGGQRQRVVIAGALVLDPEIVVADEPVSMLDVSIRTEILNLMLDLRRERDLTYLFITHDLSVAWVIADRIAVMYLGKIMELGPAERGHQRPAPPVHAGARVGDADAGAAAAGAPGAPGHPGRRDARRGAHPDGLPVPPALPAGGAGRDPGALPQRGAAAHRPRATAARPPAGWPNPGSRFRPWSAASARRRRVPPPGN